MRASIPMWTNNHQRYLPHSVRPKFIFCIVCVLAIFAPRLRAQESDEFDSYKLKLGGFWLYSSPSGTIESSVENGAIDLQKDLGFNSYSTGAGKLDWKFTHKNHFYLVGVAFN